MHRETVHATRTEICPSEPIEHKEEEGAFLVDEEKSVASNRIAHGAKLGPAVGQLDTRGRHEGGKWRMGTGKAVRNALCAEHMHA